MKLEFIPKVIMLLAGAVVAVVAVIRDLDTTWALELLLGTLIVFYLIGLIAKKIIQMAMEGNMFVKRREPVQLGNIDFQDASLDDISGEGAPGSDN